MSVLGDIHVEVKDQAGKFVPISNGKIDATKKEKFYDEILKRGKK